ncbi:MAG TPA: ParB N-terminal domain-containing protein, partial [Trebonia sp.]|nr:ParB N-terminal domain-containing protein [Trebonia sp.]
MAQHSRRALVIAGGFGVPPAEEVDPTADGRLSLKNLERLPAREVPAAALSAGVYLRQGGTRAAHVQALIEAAESGELPPVLVQQDGWRVIDGLHRLEAARTRGDRLVRARFVDCTDSEALVLAMAANSAHGLPLARPDRVAGARHVLAAHPDWSDRAIAAISGLSAGTIAALRERPADGERDTGKRLGRDGRRRPVAAGEGRRRAAEYISAHPDAPLRQVARETDVSLGTVHDVSVRLRRGAAPETGGRPAPRPVRAVPPPAPAPAALSPGGAVPGGTVPGGTIPGGAVPGGTIPGGTVPGGTVPGNTISAGRRRLPAQPGHAGRHDAGQPLRVHQQHHGEQHALDDED